MIDNRNYREYYLRSERTAEQRRKDLVVAFDEIHELKCKMRSFKLKIWALTSALTLAGCLIGWLANQLMACVQAAAK